MHNFLEMVTYHLQKVMLLHLQHLLHIISLYHHITSPWLSSLMACRWQVATLSWAAMYTVTFTFLCLYLNYTEKYNWRQMIQISEGKSALWWEQKRQMSGGKCVKCAEGKWTITNTKPPHKCFLKIIGLGHFWYFLGLSERYYLWQLLLITL